MYSKQNTYRTFEEKPTAETEITSEIEFVQSDLSGLNTKKIERQESAPMLQPYTKLNNPHSSDYVNPTDILKKCITVGYQKALSTSHILSTFRVVLKAMLSGSYLAFSITLTVAAMAAGWDNLSATLLFPTGFVILILMGNDLATGNFALLPLAYLFYRNKNKKREISVCMILTNWCIVYLGNFCGALLYLYLLWSGMTHFGNRNASEYEAFKTVLCSVTTNKVISYKATGGLSGWIASVNYGILCNWMVTLGVLLNFSSISTIGKIVAMYIPIAIFISIGFEHSIVNLFLLPAGLAYECNTYTFGEWWVWNQIPVTFGNIIGGVFLTTCMYYFALSDKLKK